MRFPTSARCRGCFRSPARRSAASARRSSCSDRRSVSAHGSRPPSASPHSSRSPVRCTRMGLPIPRTGFSAASRPSGGWRSCATAASDRSARSLSRYRCCCASLLLGTLGERLDAGSVAAAVVAVGALSRTAALLPMSLLDPARSTGSSHAVGQPTRATLATAWRCRRSHRFAVRCGDRPPLRRRGAGFRARRSCGARADAPVRPADRRPNRGRHRRDPAARRDRSLARPLDRGAAMTK